MKFGQFMLLMLQNNFFYQKLYEKCGLETSSRLFLTFKEPWKKDSKEVTVLIRTNFDSFAIIYLM